MMIRIKDRLWVMSTILIQFEEPKKIHLSPVGSLQIWINGRSSRRLEQKIAIDMPWYCQQRILGYENTKNGAIDNHQGISTVVA